MRTPHNPHNTQTTHQTHQTSHCKTLHGRRAATRLWVAAAAADDRPRLCVLLTHRREHQTTHTIATTQTTQRYLRQQLYLPVLHVLRYATPNMSACGLRTVSTRYFARE